MNRSTVVFVVAGVLGLVVGILLLTPGSATVMVNDTVSETTPPNHPVDCGSVVSPTPPGSGLGLLAATGQFTDAELTLLADLATAPKGGGKECADALAGKETGAWVVGTIAIGLAVGAFIMMPRREKVAPASPGDETGGRGGL